MASAPTPTNAAPRPPTDLPLPPGSAGLPLVGETLDFLRSTVDFVDQRRAKHGNIFRTHLLGSPTIMMFGPEANRWIFAGEDKYLQNRWSYAIRQLLGDKCLTMLNGEEHRERRRLLMPHFSQQAMREFVPTIQAITERHLAAWAAQPGPLTVFHAMQELVFEIAIALIMGTDGVDRPYLSERFRIWTAGLFTVLTLDVAWTTFGKARQAGREMIAVLNQIVERRMGLAEQPADILGSLIMARDDAGRAFEREVIVDELLLLLFAGHDTTVAALSNLIMLLGQHPEVTARARAEVQAADLPNPLTHATLKTMPYLNQVIHEGLRIIPPIGGAFRVTTEEVTYGEYRIPQGWTVMLSPRGTHRGAPWTNPTEFDPDRWSPERAEQKQPGAFIAFGGGPRVCLGTHFALVEMQVVMTLLLRDYRWELLPDQDLSMKMLPTPKPRSGILVTFTRPQ
jgi:cytochrome P450